MIREKTPSNVPPGPVPAACDRCARETTAIEIVAGAALCAGCKYDVQHLALSDYMSDIVRWNRRPQTAGKLWSVTHA